MTEKPDGAGALLLLQCDHAVEGVEWAQVNRHGCRREMLQCDHAVEGVECLSCGLGKMGKICASM